MARKKIAATNTADSNPIAKNRTALSIENRTRKDVISPGAYTLFPAKSDWICKWAQTLLDWSEQEDSLTIHGFCRYANIQRSQLYRWAETYSEMKNALVFALNTIGERREIMGLRKQFDAGMVMKTAHLYDPSWDEVNKYHAALRKDEEANDANRQFIVTMNRPEVISKEQLAQEVSAID